MFTTLYAKTFGILGLQLGLTWLTTVGIIAGLRALHRTGRFSIIYATTNDQGELDLELHWHVIRPWFIGLLVVDIALFIALLIWGDDNLRLGLLLFSVWSLLTGVQLALALIAVDENLGGRVLAITTLTTLGAALIGMRPGLNLSFLGPILFWLLLALLIAGVARHVVAIPRPRQRLISGAGVVIFVGYLLFDFNRLARLQEQTDANTWPVAMELAINIYLDVINLFLLLLDALGE